MTTSHSDGRRAFIRKVSMGGAMAFGLSHIAATTYAGKKPAKIKLEQGDVILFQGDSITDAGRNREQGDANNARALGTGYAFMAASKLLRDHAGRDLRIYNRGISGNKVYQLADRWNDDCLELKPDVLSILIGVNDFWHMINGKYEGTLETYRNDFTALLERTKEQLPDVKLIIGEPFAVAGVKAVDATWFPRFTEYQQAARDIANKFNAAFIPYQQIFDKASKSVAPSYWTSDGVHPSLAGAELMAEAVLANFGA